MTFCHRDCSSGLAWQESSASGFVVFYGVVRNRSSTTAVHPRFSNCYSASHKDPYVLGPLLNVLYTAELRDVIAQHGLCFHQYADDSEVYVSTMVNEAPLAVQRFTACVRAINDWMSSASRLKLNPTKTEVLWLGSCQQLSQISNSVIPLQSTIRVVESARDHGVVIDSVSTCSSTMPVWVLPPASTPSSSEIIDTWNSQNSRPSVHIVSPGLL